MAAIVNGVVSALRNYSRKQTSAALLKYGLRYEDVLADIREVDTAVHRLDESDYEARNRRRRRALDLSLKRKYVPKELQSYDPYQSYMGDLLAEAQRESADKRELSL